MSSRRPPRNQRPDSRRVVYARHFDDRAGRHSVNTRKSCCAFLLLLNGCAARPRSRIAARGVGPDQWWSQPHPGGEKGRARKTLEARGRRAPSPRCSHPVLVGPKKTNGSTQLDTECESYLMARSIHPVQTVRTESNARHAHRQTGAGDVVISDGSGEIELLPRLWNFELIVGTGPHQHPAGWPVQPRG